MGEELCNVGKVLDEKCDLLVYSRKVGRQQIGSLSQEGRDLLTLRTKCTFDALSDVCIHHEKKYIDRYQATQRYCVNPFNALTYLSSLTSSFLEARVGYFGSTFDITPPGYPVQGIVFV